MGRGGPGDPVPGNLRNLNMISVTAAPHSCHIHWVDWLKLSISLLFGAQWRQNLAMVVGAASWSSARWQTGSHVSSVNILWLMVVVVSPVEEDPVAADCWLKLVQQQPLAELIWDEKNHTRPSHLPVIVNENILSIYDNATLLYGIYCLWYDLKVNGRISIERRQYTTYDQHGWQS